MKKKNKKKVLDSTTMKAITSSIKVKTYEENKA